jgi:AAA+ ATPase superfamily predicted ATPase
MHSLSPEKSREFLVTGFREAGKEISEKETINVQQELGGIVGWLTIFGNTTLSMDMKEALKKSVKKGSMLAYSELDSFLGMRKPAKKRYIALLQLLAEREMRWVDLKRSLQIELKERISDPQFSNYLNSLRDYGFILLTDNIYSIPDPLLKKALRGGVSNL